VVERCCDCVLQQRAETVRHLVLQALAGPKGRIRRSRRVPGMEPKRMNLFEIEIGRKYKCDRQDGQYFATVKEKRDGAIGVMLGDKVGKIDDPGDLDQPDTLGLVWVEPKCVHPM
jgi:hypothetical protein